MGNGGGRWAAAFAENLVVGAPVTTPTTPLSQEPSLTLPLMHAGWELRQNTANYKLRISVDNRCMQRIRVKAPQNYKLRTAKHAALERAPLQKAGASRSLAEVRTFVRLGWTRVQHINVLDDLIALKHQ